MLGKILVGAVLLSLHLMHKGNSLHIMAMLSMFIIVSTNYESRLWLKNLERRGML